MSRGLSIRAKLCTSSTTQLHIIPGRPNQQIHTSPLEIPSCLPLDLTSPDLAPQNTYEWPMIQTRHSWSPPERKGTKTPRDNHKTNNIYLPYLIDLYICTPAKKSPSPLTLVIALLSHELRANVGMESHLPSRSTAAFSNPHPLLPHRYGRSAKYTVCNPNTVLYGIL